MIDLRPTEILLSADQIQKRVASMALEIRDEVRPKVLKANARKILGI